MIQKIATKNREEWKALRQKYIGGSDAASVVGMNPFRSAYALWAEKTGLLPGFEGNLATEVGSYLEEFVAKKFEAETGKKVRRCNMSLLNDAYPFAIANIDREIVGEDAGLEIKTTDSLNLKKFRGGEYPANYYVQCVHYLAVTGKQRWYLAVLIGNREFKWFTIDRDEDEIKALMDAERDFWNHVERKIPPAADGSKSTTTTIGTLHPVSNGQTIQIGGFESDLLRYSALKKQIGELDTQKTEIENRIKSYMGDAAKGESGRWRVSWASQERKTFDRKKFEAERGTIDPRYFTVSKARVFRVTEK